MLYLRKDVLGYRLPFLYCKFQVRGVAASVVCAAHIVNHVLAVAVASKWILVLECLLRKQRAHRPLHHQRHLLLLLPDLLHVVLLCVVDHAMPQVEQARKAQEVGL